MESLAETVYPHVDRWIAAAYSLGVYVEPTLVLVPEALKSKVSIVADSVGMDAETVAMVLGLFLCYPLGGIMSVVPVGAPKHLFSFLLGAFLLQFVLGVQWIHQLLSTMMCYFCFQVFSPSVNRYLVPAIAISYCIVGHLHRQYINYMGWDLDFTGPQMVVTIKLYSLAWNLYDGHVMRESKKGQELPRATSRCKDFCVDEVPSLLNYLGYVFCFSTVLAGPSFEYSTYLAAASGSNLMKGGKLVPPSRFKPVLVPLVQSLCALVVYVAICPNFPLTNTVSQKLRPYPLEGDTSLYTLGFWKGYAFLFISLGFNRSKYYFAWKNAQGSCNTWYAGFEGHEKEYQKDAAIQGWELTNNVDLWRCETASNVQMGTKFWNKKTALWLNRYVYARSGGSLAATYFMSAFWHGFYPGYYMFFMSLPLLTMCERFGRAKLSWRFSSPGDGRFTAWGCTTIVTTHLLLAYCSVPFVFLSLEWSWEAWRELKFFGHGVMLVFIGIMSVLPSDPNRGGKKKKV
ncbi:hypothetical protein TrST_g9208 [Triparma strigata]|uniref:Uncharacterized protein n=1 Tax=Triparma strigata TaxID=1606541 RepID=A0A9W7AVQ1_9STRA|nr:hypothetical protein TrST_g9208 [Triparma strigata]